MSIKPIKAPAPYLPYPPKPSHCAALRALKNCTADEYQQHLALEYIMLACGTNDNPYRPDSARDTDFALGKQFVGKQIFSAINTTITE